jgi:hypothetical protein
MKFKICAIALLPLAAFLSGCTSAQKLSASTTIPAAEGSLECGKADNDNTRIKLKVKHLASPERLVPPASTYVVWTRTGKSDAPQNIGALTVDGELTGRLETVTAQRSFEVFITPEASGQVKEPEGDELMWANCSR